MARVTTQFTGIIMYRQDYRERDLLVKMLTDKIGPAMFFVKNAKNIKKYLKVPLGHLL
mgnify:CR=1 FL=1